MNLNGCLFCESFKSSLAICPESDWLFCWSYVSSLSTFLLSAFFSAATAFFGSSTSLFLDLSSASADNRCGASRHYLIEIRKKLCVLNEREKD